jgi:hypothetical protein
LQPVEAVVPGVGAFDMPTVGGLDRVGFQNSAMVSVQGSGCGLVLIDEPTQDRSTSDPAINRLGNRRCTVCGVFVPRTPSPSLSCTFPEADLDITVPTRTSMIAYCGPQTRLPDARSRTGLASAARPLRAAKDAEILTLRHEIAVAEGAPGGPVEVTVMTVRCRGNSGKSRAWPT